MAYIGKIPTVGNFQKCDAISVVNGQAAYTMQVSSVNVSPETVNHMIVSLNGVIQSPTTAYTISGATLTFASNLATGDVIDFVILLGNVLDVGTPTDNTVATAKIQDDAVTLAKMAAGTDGNIISYDASGNPVAIATGSDGQVLTSAGAGQPPAFEAVSAGGTLTAKQATTSGSSVDFTGIPAGTKWITVLFNSMGSNGTGLFGIQLGDAGGIETSGYLGNLSGINSGTSGQRAIYASQFVIVNPAISAEAYAGIVHLRLFEASSYTWSMSNVNADEGGGQTCFFGAGQKSLSAELTQIRVMTANTFDEGNVSIQYGE